MENVQNNFKKESSDKMLFIERQPMLYHVVLNYLRSFFDFLSLRNIANQNSRASLDLLHRWLQAFCQRIRVEGMFTRSVRLKPKLEVSLAVSLAIWSPFLTHRFLNDFSF